jgi:hypothetical protein
VRLVDAVTGEPGGIVCLARRAPCPCPRGTCAVCGAPVAGVSPLPLGEVELDVDCGSAGRAGGTLAVRRLADGTLAGVLLGPGADPPAGQWRGTLHAHQLPGAAAWLADAVTPP